MHNKFWFAMNIGTWALGTTFLIFDHENLGNDASKNKISFFFMEIALGLIFVLELTLVKLCDRFMKNITYCLQILSWILLVQ